MLRRMNGNTREDMITIDMTLIIEKVRKNRLRWFGNVTRTEKWQVMVMIILTEGKKVNWITKNRLLDAIEIEDDCFIRG